MAVKLPMTVGCCHPGASSAAEESRKFAQLSEDGTEVIRLNNSDQD